MKLKQIAVLILFVGCIIFPIGAVILLLEALYSGYDNSLFKKLLKELENE